MESKTPVITLKDYSFAYSGSRENILNNVSMAVMAGECHCITGPTGSGKTTLLLAMNGSSPGGTQQGEIFFPAASNGVIRTGIILQNPETQLLCSTIGSEVAFGLENYCVKPLDMAEQIQSSISAIGLEHPLSLRTSSLSMGQKYRLLLASFLAMKPSVILLDEPCAQLDTDGIYKLKKMIINLKARGISFVITEHHPRLISEVSEYVWQVNKGGTISPASAILENMTSVRCPVSQKANDDTIISVKNLLAGGRADRPVLSDVTFSVQKGMKVLLSGPNGAGKTTLLRCIAGFVKATGGEINIFGVIPDPKKLRNAIGYMCQNPDRQLFEGNVFEEILFSLKRLNGTGRESRNQQVNNILARMGISDIADVSPHRISFGQKHLVALASVISKNPEILILDDPFAGLDNENTERVMGLLSDINKKNGTTIICASHDHNTLSGWADSCIRMDRGNIIEASS